MNYDQGIYYTTSRLVPETDDDGDTVYFAMSGKNMYPQTPTILLIHPNNLSAIRKTYEALAIKLVLWKGDLPNPFLHPTMPLEFK